MIVAHLVSVGAPLSERARLLFLSFPNHKDVQRTLEASLQTGVWAGPSPDTLSHC